LLAHHEQAPEELARAHRLLTIPDWLNWRLCGVLSNEWSNASTTQLLRAGGAGWDDELFDRLQLPRRLVSGPARSGTVLGPLRDELAGEGHSPQVVLPACHDTGSAFAALPLPAAGSACISCGTWSLMGCLLDEAVLSEAARTADLSNELAWDGRTRLLKNIMGLWVLQECRRAFADDGRAHDYAALTALAEAAEAPEVVLDVDDQRFFPPGTADDPYPARVQQWYRERGQQAPASDGAIARAVLEGLAQSYARCRHDLERVTGQRIERVQMIGGGIRNQLLCRLTAEACGCPVETGAAEATALGNALVQAVGLGLIAADDLPAVAAASSW